jgi:hypothetical protein
LEAVSAQGDGGVADIPVDLAQCNADRPGRVGEDPEASLSVRLLVVAASVPVNRPIGGPVADWVE